MPPINSLAKETNKFLLNAGANLSASFVKGFSLENIMAYGMVGYNEAGYNPGTTGDYTVNSLETSGVNAQFGVGYQPESFRKLFNANVFFAGYANYLNTEIGTFHFDGITKLNVENKKPSLDYSLSEVSFNRFVKSSNCVENDNTDRIVAITEKFNFDEAYYFDHESRSREHDSWCTGNFNTGFVAGLRYKYFTDADKSIYNGFYGYGLGSYALENSVSFEVEAEVGRYDAELEAESRGSKGLFTEKVYSLYEFDWANGKLAASVSDVSLYLAHLIINDNGSINVYMQSNYKNLSTNTAENNGFFFTPGFSTSVGGACTIDAGATVGFNSLKNFKWNAQSSFVVSY